MKEREGISQRTYMYDPRTQNSVGIAWGGVGGGRQRQEKWGQL